MTETRTTYEKMLALRDELRTLAIEDTTTEMRPFVEGIQMAAGFGLDIFDWLIPDDPADADGFVDGLLGLFVRMRGDDLPPFDIDRYGEVAAAEASGEAAGE